jgi:hypothetical protein
LSQSLRQSSLCADVTGTGHYPGNLQSGLIFDQYKKRRRSQHVETVQIDTRGCAMIQRKLVLRQLVRALGTATALLAASALCVRAQATFSAPQQVSGNMEAKGEPEVATGPNGNIYVVWSDLEGVCSPSTSCTDTVFFSRSTDAGATYSAPQALSTNGGDPQLAVDSTGNINVIWNSTGPDFARSTDGGATFSSPVYIAPGMSPYLGFAVVGYRAIAVDGAGNIDVVWMDTNSSQVFFARSTNSGASFSSPLNVSNYANGASNPTVAVDATGNIDIVWQGSVSGHDPFDLFFTRLTNGGTSFSTPRDISNTPQGAYYDQLSVDPSGNIDVAWDSDCPNSSSCPVVSSDVFFSQSKDGGSTFSAPAQISNSQNEPISRVLMGFDSSGNTYLVWPQVTSSGSNAYFSGAAGAAFSAPRQIASAFADRMSVDRSGAIYVSAAAADAYLLRSTDHGATFSSTNITNGADAPDTVELESAVDAGGNVSVVWPSYNYNTYKWAVFVSHGTAASAASLTLNPASVTGGGSSTATVTLNQPAPSGGAVISLTSNNAAASVPASITIAGGSSSGTFTINTTAVVASTPVAISASWNGTTESSTLTVLQAVITSVTFDPTGVTGGNSAVGTVSLSGPAPAGGALICLASQNSAVAPVPSSIAIPETATSGTFSIKTSTVTASTTVVISACYGASSATGSLTVQPATQGAFSVTASPAALMISAPGQSTTALLTFISKNGFTGAGVLSSATCGTVATEKISCTLTAFTLPANGTATATLTVSTAAPSSAGVSASPRNILLMLLLCFALAPFATPRKERRLNFAFAAILLAMLMANVGCGGAINASASNSNDSNSARNSGTPAGAVQSVNVAVTINGTTMTVPNVTITVE